MKFEYPGDGSVGLKYEISNKYVAAEDYGNGQLVANRSSIGDWEKFEWGKTTKSATVETSGNTLAAGIKIYPNPALANDHIKIDGILPTSHENIFVQLFNTNGAMLYSGQVSTDIDGSFVTSFNTDLLKQGIYLISISGEKAIYASQILVIK
ncbi:MAG: T9SS type A sorting domain-containing protein [Bacteroidales bacterium]|nr:T9SS type A sorting domain-containing protein [Bacteroidales bacterium]